MGWSEDDRTALLTRLGLPAGPVDERAGSFGKVIWLVAGRWLVRLSRTPADQERAALGLAAGLPEVPRLLGTDTVVHGGETWQVTVLTLAPGVDLEEAAPALSEAALENLGRQAAGFLDRLHARTGPVYDVGLYIPALLDWTGTWAEGHGTYLDRLAAGVPALDAKARVRSRLTGALDIARGLLPALAESRGPRLLHQDFHPKNLIVDGGRLTGVVDWECCRWGEPDFDLVHLVHWALFPRDGAGLPVRSGLAPVLRGLWTAGPGAVRVPRLADRLTVYQIEHEVQQMVWAGSPAADRLERLEFWLDDGVSRGLAGLGVPRG